MKKNAAPFASAVALLAWGIALSACSGGQQPSPSGPLPPQSRVVRPAAATPSPIPYQFQTVDDPKSTTNAVTGIDSYGDIVGSIGSGSASDPTQGYSSVAPYVVFVPLTYTGVLSMGITGISVTPSRTVIVGWVDHPPTLRGTWGYYLINGVPGLTKDRKGMKGKTSTTELLGVNDAETAVGFTLDTYGSDAPIVLNIITGKYKFLKPPGFTNNTGAEATGVDDNGDIVGWVGPAKNAAGFFERLGTFYSIQYPTAKATEALAVNTTEGQVEQVAGSYDDSSGTSHGFILTGPTQGPSGQVWQSVDYPYAQGTVITGINANDDICGYYYDTSGIKHGFVAVPNISGS